MTIAQIRYFLAVCKFGSYTKAAESMYVSQPTVSFAIRELENECGTPLFEKKGNTISLTPAGEVFRIEAEKIARQFDRLEKEIKASQLSRNFVRVGFSTFAGNEAFPAILRNYRLQYPEITVDSMERGNQILLELLLDHQLDILIMGTSDNQAYPEHIKHVPLTPFRFCYCVSSESHLAGRESITLAEMAQYPLVTLGEGGGFLYRSHIEDVFRRSGLTPNIILASSQMYTLERMIVRGAAAGFLPASVCHDDPRISVIPAPSFFPELHVDLFWDTSAVMFPSIENFIQTAKDTFPNKKS